MLSIGGGTKQWDMHLLNCVVIETNATFHFQVQKATKPIGVSPTNKHKVKIHKQNTKHKATTKYKKTTVLQQVQLTTKMY